MNKNLRRAIHVLIAASAIAAAPAHALDGVAFEVGTSDDDVDMARVALTKDWKRRWFQGRDWHLGGYWEAALGYWNGRSTAVGQHEALYEVGLTPVFRIQPNGLVGPFVEAAIGLHLLSHASIGDKRLATSFQFGDHIGVGYRFGAKSHYEVAYRFQHLSNASIKRPNPGINFHQIRLQYHF